MQSQQTSYQHRYTQFTQKVTQLLTCSNNPKQLEHQLVTYPIQLMLDLIHDESAQPDTRRMTCSILKLKISNKQLCLQQNLNPQQLLARLQTLYMINSRNNTQLAMLQAALEISLEKIFEVHFDDMQKLKMFQQICGQLPKEPLCKQQKHLSFLMMIVRAMDYLSLNNEVLVGELVVYLGEVLKGVKARWENQGNQLQVIGDKEEHVSQDICEILIKTISLMRQIKQIIDTNNEQQQSVVQQFMTNSTQLRSHMFTILSLQSILPQPHPKIATIWTANPRLNKLKAQTMILWSQVWQYYAEIDLLELLFASVLTVTKSLIIDETQTIITYCLLFLERSCTHREYNSIFFKMTQNLTIKLFELIAINEAEYSLIQNDTDYFVELNDDFCKTQEFETVKTRAGSLLANLTLAIDGYLTFVTQLALVGVRQLEEGTKSQVEVKLLEGFMAGWPCTKQQFIQASILILSSISDQISKRNDLTYSILHHLKTITPILPPPHPLAQQPLFILRYMQLFSFFSFPHCLDPFIKHFSSTHIYQTQLSKSFQTLMRYHDKKSSEMVRYVKEIADSIMLIGEQLTPLLQQEIMRDNRVVRCFKEKVLEKLVGWLAGAYEKEEVVRVNKLSTLVVMLLEHNKLSALKQAKEDIQLLPFSSQLLNTYLSPLYTLLTPSNHPCQQSLIQIAIVHIQYLFDSEEITPQDLEKFYFLGKTVIQRNRFSLNNCLMLFNALVCPHVKANRKGGEWKFDQVNLRVAVKVVGEVGGWIGEVCKEVIGDGDGGNKLQSLNQPMREEDVWELLQLAQICLFCIMSNQHILKTKPQPQVLQLTHSSSKLLQTSLSIAQTCHSPTLRTKVISLLLQIVSTFPQNTQHYTFLTQLKYPSPSQFPPSQYRKYLYLLLQILNSFIGQFSTQLRTVFIKTVIDLIYFLQNQKTHTAQYQQKLYINGDGVSLNASQKRHKLYCAFDYRIEFNPHDCFRQLIKHYPEKEELQMIDHDLKYQGKIRDICDKIVVGEKTRKRIVVKRPH